MCLCFPVTHAVLDVPIKIPPHSSCLKVVFSSSRNIFLCVSLLQIANSMMSTWTGPPAMKSLFTRMFCCKSCPNIVKTNSFINFQSYFLQKAWTWPSNALVHFCVGLLVIRFFRIVIMKGTCCNLTRSFSFLSVQTMPVAMALLRDVQNLCPKEVLNFILDLIKYNDNRKNKVTCVL